MTDSPSSIIETVARAIIDAEMPMRLASHAISLDDAKDLARAALLAIEGAGYAIVPIEPTEAMLDAPNWRADAGRGVYAALLSSRPRVTEQ
jgi:hypothetical protein